MLAGVAPVEIDPGSRARKAAVFLDPFHQRGHPRAARFEKGNAQIWIAVGNSLRDYAVKRKLHREPERERRFVVMRVVDLAQGAKAVSRVHRDRQTGIIRRGPNRLHRRIVDAYISRDTE